MKRNSQPNRESTDESRSPETQLLTRRDGGIKRDGEKDREIGHEEDQEKTANGKLKPRYTAQ